MRRSSTNKNKNRPSEGDTQSSHAPLAFKHFKTKAHRGEQTTLASATFPEKTLKTGPTRGTNQAHMRHSPRKDLKNRPSEGNKPRSHAPLSEVREKHQTCPTAHDSKNKLISQNEHSKHLRGNNDIWGGVLKQCLLFYGTSEQATPIEQPRGSYR